MQLYNNLYNRNYKFDNNCFYRCLYMFFILLLSTDFGGGGIRISAIFSKNQYCERTTVPIVVIFIMISDLSSCLSIKAPI